MLIPLVGEGLRTPSISLATISQSLNHLLSSLTGLALFFILRFGPGLSHSPGDATAQRRLGIRSRIIKFIALEFHYLFLITRPDAFADHIRITFKLKIDQFDLFTQPIHGTGREVEKEGVR